MTLLYAAGAFSVTVRHGDALLVLDSADRGRFVVSGYAGPALPATVTDPRITQRAASGPAPRWTLACAELTCDFEARAVERHEPLPGLFDGALAPHALKPRERRVARWLLRLMRWPGSARLLRAWHARRR